MALSYWCDFFLSIAFHSWDIDGSH